MTALIIVCAVIVLFALLLLLPVGFTLEYSGDGMYLWLKIGTVGKKLYPSEENPEKEARKKEKAERKKQKKLKKQQEQAEVPKNVKQGGEEKKFREIVSIICEVLGKLKKSMLIRELTLRFTFASPDPAKAALSFGAASAGAGITVPMLYNNFRIKKLDIQNQVDFNSAETRVYAKARISIRIIWAIAIAIHAGYRYYRLKENKNAAAID